MQSHDRAATCHKRQLEGVLTDRRAWHSLRPYPKRCRRSVTNLRVKKAADRGRRKRRTSAPLDDGNDAIEAYRWDALVTTPNYLAAGPPPRASVAACIRRRAPADPSGGSSTLVG